MIRDFAIGHVDAQYGYAYCPNSAGGIGVKGIFDNTRNKTIKYVSIYFIPINSVEDPVPCTIRNHYEYGVQLTGPIQPGESKHFAGENLWFNHSISEVRVSKVVIIYMDGTTETLLGADITIQNHQRSQDGMFTLFLILGAIALMLGIVWFCMNV